MNNERVSDEKQISFEDIYKNYQADIFLYAFHSMQLSKQEAEDISSEAFLLLLEGWSVFEPKTSPHALAWLRKTVRFLSYNLKRKEQSLSTIPLGDINDENVEITVKDLTETYEIHIRNIKNNLTPEEYQLFEEVVIRRRDRKQLAEKLGVTTNTLKVRWHRVKNKIKKIL